MLGQLAQGIVEGNKIAGSLVRHLLGGRDIDDADTTSVGSLLPLPRDVDQDVPHQPGGHRHEMGAVLPADVLPPQQADERLVDQSRGLEDVPWTFTPEAPASDLAKLGLNEWHERFECRGAALLPGHEQARDL